jgi:hypothetical protein
MVDFRGTIFKGVDNRLMSLKMVHSNLTPVALFSAAGVNLEAEDCFYGKSILLLRGHYRPITNFHLTMMEKASAMFRNDPANKGKEIVEVNEITMRNLVRHRKAGMEDFLDRVDCLGALKKTVLVTGIFRFHRLAEYLTQRTKGSVGFVIGVPLLSKILDEDFYNDLPGGILEGMGRLFLPGVKLFVHPGYDPLSGMYVSGHTLTVRKPAEDLHRYLVSKGATMTNEVFRQAICHNNIEMVRFAIEHRCPLHICLPYLCWENKRPEILQLLLARTELSTFIQAQRPSWDERVYAFMLQQ